MTTANTGTDGLYFAINLSTKIAVSPSFNTHVFFFWKLRPRVIGLIVYGIYHIRRIVNPDAKVPSKHGVTPFLFIAVWDFVINEHLAALPDEVNTTIMAALTIVAARTFKMRKNSRRLLFNLKYRIYMLLMRKDQCYNYRWWRDRFCMRHWLSNMSGYSLELKRLITNNFSLQGTLS